MPANAGSLATASMTIRADRSQLLTDLNQIREFVSSQLRTVVANARTQLGGIAKGIAGSQGGGGGGAGGPFGGLFQGMASVAGGNLISAGIARIGDAFSGLGKQMMATNAQMEQYRISFGVLLKDQAAGERMIKAITKMAAETPFEVPGLVSATQQMLAYGFQADQVLPMLRTIGDTASASPQGMAMGLERITRALGQIHAKGKLSAEEMRQLTEAGVPGWEMLAQAMGKTTAEVMKLTERGAIPADKAIDALMKGMKQKFGGMMAAQSQTFNGLMSTLRDNVNMTLMKIGGPVFEAVKGGLKELMAYFDTDEAKAMIENLAFAVKNFVGWVKDTVVTVYRWAAANKETLITIAKVAAGVVAGIVAFKALVAVVGIAGAMLASPFAPVLAAIAAVVGAVWLFRDSLNAVINNTPALKSIKDLFLELGDTVGKVLGGIKDAIAMGDIGAAWGILVAGMKIAWQTCVVWIREKWEGLKEWMFQNFPEVALVFNDIVASMRKTWAEFIGFLMKLWQEWKTSQAVEETAKLAGQIMARKEQSKEVAEAKQVTAWRKIGMSNMDISKRLGHAVYDQKHYDQILAGGKGSAASGADVVAAIGEDFKAQRRALRSTLDAIDAETKQKIADIENTRRRWQEKILTGADKEGRDELSAQERELADLKKQMDDQLAEIARKKKERDEEAGKKTEDEGGFGGEKKKPGEEKTPPGKVKFSDIASVGDNIMMALSGSDHQKKMADNMADVKVNTKESVGKLDKIANTIEKVVVARAA